MPLLVEHITLLEILCQGSQLCDFEYSAENMRCLVHHSIMFANDFEPPKGQELRLVSFFVLFFSASLHAEFVKVYRVYYFIFQVLHYCIGLYNEVLICFLSPLLQIMHGSADFRKTKALHLYFGKVYEGGIKSNATNDVK